MEQQQGEKEGNSEKEDGVKKSVVDCGNGSNVYVQQIGKSLYHLFNSYVYKSYENLQIS